MAQEDETGSRLLDQLHRNWPDRASMPVEIIVRLFRLRDLIHSRSQNATRRFGLTWGEFEALFALRVGDPPHQMTPTQIANLMIVTSGGLTKILQNLESMGLVRRVPNETDARSCYVALTAEGDTLISALADRIAETADPLIESALCETEQSKLSEMLAKLTCAIERSSD